MDHVQRFRIIGFNAKYDKPRGIGIRFGISDQFVCDHLPSQDSLRAYAKSHGYIPAGTRQDSEICQPIYEVIGEGPEYLSCDICFPLRFEPVIDNLETRG